MIAQRFARATLLIALSSLAPGAGWAGSTLSVSDGSIYEGNSGTSELPFSVTRSGDTGSQLVFQYRTEDVTATGGIDYVSQPSTTFVVAPGTNGSTLDAPILGDTNVESDETLHLYLDSIAAIGASPSFGARKTFAVGATVVNHRPLWVRLADFNGDGRLDVVVANADSNDVAVLLNTTSAGATAASFGSAVVFPTGPTPETVEAADINGDGRPDLVLATGGVSPSLAVLLNTTSAGATQPNFSTFARFGDCGYIATVGDFNGDGRPDVAVDCGHEIRILLNTTSPGATAPSLVASGTAVTDDGYVLDNFVVGDLNGDGKPDLIFTDTPGRVLAAINRTAPGSATVTFGAPRAFPGSGDDIAAGLQIADIDNDGKLDVAVLIAKSTATTARPPRVDVLLNETSPGALIAELVGPNEQFTTPDANPLAIAVGDLNGDGRTDLCTSDPRTFDPFQVILNTAPSGASSLRYQIIDGNPVGSQPRSIAIGDLNGDGRPDVVLANSQEDNVAIFLNTTGLSDDPTNFTAASPVPVGAGPMGALARDFNGDGIADLVTADVDDNAVSVALGTTSAGATTASFSNAVGFAVGGKPNQIATSDFNSDGMPDLVATESTGNAVALLFNTMAPGATTAAFVNAGVFTVPAGPSSVATCDVNGDGKSDLVVSSSGAGSVSILLNNTTAGSNTAGFSDAGTVASAAGIASIAVADLNGDGKCDLVTVNPAAHTLSAIINTTTPGAMATSLGSANNVTTGGAPTYVAIADVNGDGKPDVSFADSSNNTVVVLVNTTAPGSVTATFAASASFPAGDAPNSVNFSDLNGDGRPDVAVTSSSGDQVRVLLNTTTPGSTNPTFTSGGVYLTERAPSSITVTDVNRDGQRDLLVANGASGDVTILLNTRFTVTLLGNPAVGTIVDDDADRIPDSYSFSDQVDVPTNSAVVSNAVSVTGINTSSPISVTGGEYSLDGGAFTSTSGGVIPGQSVRVRHVSASTSNTAVNTTLTIGGVSDTFTSITASPAPGPDTTPTPFSFATQENVGRATVVTSDAAVVSGIDAAASVTITGGEYSIDGGAFTSGAGTTNAGQAIRLRHTSAAGFSTSTTTTVTIGGVEGSFTSTTEPVDQVPDPFKFAARAAVAVDTIVISDSIVVTGINNPAPMSISGGEYSIDGGPFTGAAGSVIKGQSVRLRHTSAASENTVTQTILTIGGVTGSFVSTTAAASPTSPTPGGGSESLIDVVILILLALLRRSDLKTEWRSRIVRVRHKLSFSAT